MKYNRKKEGTPTITTHEGGKGFTQSPEMALISLLAVGLDKTFYEGSNEREKRLVDLIGQVAAKDKYFAAQCLVYARTKFGQRTITHRGAVEMAKYISGEEWGKRFFGRWDKKEQKGGIVFRADDLTEIAACYFHFNQGKNLTNAMKKGFAEALKTMDRFELARYAGKNRGVSLVDIFNLVRPTYGKDVEGRKRSIKEVHDLLHGGIKQFGTSEAENSKAGQEVKKMVDVGEITIEQAKEVVQEKKASNFTELIMSEKMGYLQLLRNLKNIHDATKGFTSNKELMDKVEEILTNRDRIVASLVYPHQIDLALEFLSLELSGSVSRKLIKILDEAYEAAIVNVSELIGENTAVLIDTSGSMHSLGMSNVSIGSNKQLGVAAIHKAALIGATLGKGINADVYQFSSTTAELRYNLGDSINTIKNSFLSHEGEVGHWTQLDTAFQLFNEKKRHYERIFIISDFQIADSVLGGSQYSMYVRNSPFGVPYIYSIDLKGYGNQPFKPNSKYFNLAGYSASIYETAKMYEVDPQALMNEVKQIVI